MADQTLAVVEPEHKTDSIVPWSGAATRALEARGVRERIAREVLREGIDYGAAWTGAPKPTLLKPGSERILDALELRCEFEELRAIESFVESLFFYRYRANLYTRATGVLVATGIGSCSTYESKYRWRKGRRECPTCGSDAVIRSKQEYGGGWYCFPKRGGCGARFAVGTAALEEAADRVPNEDVLDAVNTVDKIAQKRAQVAAALALGFSEFFTQDLEDFGGIPGEAREHQDQDAPASPAPPPRRSDPARHATRPPADRPRANGRTTEREATTTSPPAARVRPGTMKVLRALGDRLGAERMTDALGTHGIETIAELTETRAAELIATLRRELE